MEPVSRALWYIESHFARALGLEEIAKVGGVSRFHLARLFTAVTGHSVFGYVRARRLTEAAKSLSRGAPDILSVALDAGYGSHEAFTRAFRDRFGPAPQEVRAMRRIDNLPLQEPLRMTDTAPVTLDPPRIVQGAPMIIAGVAERYGHSGAAGIASQWQRLVPHLGSLPQQVGQATYGVMSDQRDGGASFQYLAGVEVSTTEGLPKDFSVVRVPAQTYGVFQHKGHVSTTQKTMDAIMRTWGPKSGYAPGDQVVFFERYGESFDPITGLGGFEIWAPRKG